MDAELKEIFHRGAEESPGGWLMEGMTLRAAARRLDWRVNPAREEEETVWFLGVYRMLIGMAFECILKGIITMTRVESGTRPILPKECLSGHCLKSLASRPECAALNLSTKEVSLLDELSAYIRWAGRYPMAKKAEDFICKHHSSPQHDAELELWERIADFLADKAWIMKGGPLETGGKRLYLKRHRDSDV